MASFATVIKSLRLEKGWSQQELADRLKLTKSAINMYERGDRQPKFEVLEKIADFFNVDTDYLLGRTNKTTRIPVPKTATSDDIEIRRIQRARKNMSPDQRDKMMKILEVHFDDYFSDDFDNAEDDLD